MVCLQIKWFTVPSDFDGTNDDVLPARLIKLIALIVNLFWTAFN